MSALPRPNSGAFRHTTPTARKGRPRSTTANRAVLDAAQELILENGFNELRLEHVAARAGVGKATIYRRWASKDELAFDLLLDLAQHDTVDDVGDTRAELLAAVAGAIDALTNTAFGPILRALLSEVVIQADLDDPYRERIEQARRSEVAAVIRRGIARGDLNAAAAADVATELLIGPVYFRLLFGGDLDDTFAETITTAFLRAFGS
jgi:AcrR family transcriptional regulator